MEHTPPFDEASALNALIQERGSQWSSHARALKFDIEFRAIEEERRRVAKELHDEILPALARLIRSIQARQTDLQSSDWRIQSSDSQSGAQSSAIVEELHHAVAAMRDLLGELHPVDLEEIGLVPALGNLCKRYSRFTQRSIVFNEQTEDCCLTEHQQLCLYRAVQTVFRMFAESDNDVLLVACNRVHRRMVVTMRCVDKRVASTDWLLENQDFNTFESWSVMAGADLRIGKGSGERYQNSEGVEQFPCDLIISAGELHTAEEDTLTRIGQLTQARIKELDSIIARAREEWSEVIHRDCELFKKFAVELERKRIADDINRLIMPHLVRINQLANDSDDKNVRKEVKQQMQAIDKEVNGVIVELHPSLIDQIGLVASLRTLVARFRHATLIDTTMISNLWSHQFESIPMDTKFALYRVTQEALNNIEKHSDATRTLVTVTKNKDLLVICIEDNGKGIQRTGRNTLSRGLKIIQERATAIGATIEIQISSTFETGTLVTISLPCHGLMIDTEHLFLSSTSQGSPSHRIAST